jgi:hypothetical protein
VIVDETVRGHVPVPTGLPVPAAPGPAGVRVWAVMSRDGGHEGGARRLALIDNADPERLARACAEEGRNKFMFTATPLRVVGATGAPAHPLTIF